MNILPYTAPREQSQTNIYHSTQYSALFECLLNQEQQYGELHLGGKNRIALFDLDNTLLVGDMGDAVFAQVIAEGFSLPLTWKEYQTLCKADPASAYVEVVRALHGISFEYLIQVSKRVVQMNGEFITCEGDQVRVPRANMQMYEIIRLLREWHYEIFVVSASNDISAKIAGSVLFDIPVNNIAGIKSKVSDNKLTDVILEPIPVGVGKVAQYRLLSGDRMPMIVATDSVLDMPILDICDPDGTVIIVGENEEVYDKAKSELPLSIHLHRVPCNPLLVFQQQHRVA
jgi:phosphoserine phosphatase